jgi:hypothetical protein
MEIVACGLETGKKVGGTIALVFEPVPVSMHRGKKPSPPKFVGFVRYVKAELGV